MLHFVKNDTVSRYLFIMSDNSNSMVCNGRN